MKLILIRHGESEDDILDAYGGWADFHLTKKGIQQIKATADKIASLNLKPDVILSSPLLRAKESAEIISLKFHSPVEIFEYIKERNTYGIMCGMVKSVAKDKYPWLVTAYENDQYVDGSERQEDINLRVIKAFELICNRSEKCIFAVTHGVFLKAFIPEILNKKLVKKEDGGFLVLDIENSKASVLSQHGIEIL